MRIKMYILILIFMLTGCNINTIKKPQNTDSNSFVEKNNETLLNNAEKSNHEEGVTDNNKVERTTEDKKNDGYIEYEIDINYDKEVTKEINELVLKFSVEKEFGNYAVERHSFILSGVGSNDSWGNIEVDMNFEYPKVVNFKEDSVQEEINKKIFESFFYVKSIEELAKIDPFNNYHRYEYGTYDIKYSDKDYLSIYANTSYSNGASPAKSFFGITLNMDEGVLLKLSDFVEMDYIMDNIEKENYEVIGDDIGMHGNEATDKIVKDEMMEYINSVYDFSDLNSAGDMIFSYDINGYYIDGDFVFIYIDLLESYGRDVYLKIPLSIDK